MVTATWRSGPILEFSAHRFELVALEEASPRRRFLQHVDHRQAHQLAVLVGEPQGFLQTATSRLIVPFRKPCSWRLAT
jgi:hypothetical protein